MKILKIVLRIVLVLLLLLVIAAIYNYPKLTIVSGFASKNLASTHFIAQRSYDAITATDHDVPLIKMAGLEQAIENKVITSVYGFMPRETICRDGLGCVLVTDAYNKNQNVVKPKRTPLKNALPFPYGNNGTRDTLFKNVNYQQLETAVDKAFENYEQEKTRTVLVAYKGEIIAERYSEGFSKDTPILGWSMTKSVLATLFGVLEYQQVLDMNYRPFKALDLTGLPGKEPRITISLNDFLRMSSGLGWNEDYTAISDVTKMLFLEADMTKSQIQTDFDIAAPKTWNYSSGTTNLLSGVLRKQFDTYQEYLDFPYAALIDKIGMNSMLIETDMAGNFVGSSYGWATTRDWAKFGILHLNRGHWNGEQLFHPEWIDYITTPTANSDGTYGAHWWLNAAGKYPDVPKDLYSANGFQGQRVFIIPSKELVVVRTGLAEPPNFDANAFLKGIIDAIEE